MIKKVLVAAAALVALPIAAQAQTLQYPGFYAGIEGGGNWMFNNTVTTPFGAAGTMYPQLGWAAGGMIGYDFVGPRVEIEGVYRHNRPRSAAVTSMPLALRRTTSPSWPTSCTTSTPAERSFRTSALAPVSPSSVPRR